MSGLSLKANKGGGGHAKAPAGNHPAVLVAIVDMGTHYSEFQSVGKWQRKAYFVWELVTEKIAGTKDKNHVIGIDLALSLNEKAKLRKFIESRLGKPLPDGADYDVSAELGQRCLLGVIEKNGHPKVETVSAVPKGLPFPEPQNAPTYYPLDAIRSGNVKVPEWVPWFYGKPLTDEISQCKEIAGDPDAAKPGDGTGFDPAAFDKKDEPLPY